MAYAHILKCERELVSNTPDALLRTHRFLQRLVHSASETLGPGSVAYDMSECHVIDPASLLLMIHASQCLKRQGNWTTDAIGHGNAFSTLSVNMEHLLLPPEQRKTLAGRKAKGQYLLRRVKREADMLSELNEWVESVQEGTSARTEDVALWQMQLSEVLTNSFQHGPAMLTDGKMAPVLLVGKATDESGVQLAALDFGSGIPAVMARSYSHECAELDDGKIIRFACRKGITSRDTRQNQGAGLPSLIKNVIGAGGTLQVFSRRGMVYASNGRVRSKKLDAIPELCGTLTVIDLRLTEVQHGEG